MIAYPMGMSETPKKLHIPTEREKTIGVRVSPEEYEAIKKKADAVGLRVASYVRMLALQDAQEEVSSGS